MLFFDNSSFVSGNQGPSLEPFITRVCLILIHQRQLGFVSCSMSCGDELKDLAYKHPAQLVKSIDPMTYRKKMFAI